jgi:hypothetical protein
LESIRCVKTITQYFINATCPYQELFVNSVNSKAYFVIQNYQIYHEIFKSQKISPENYQEIVAVLEEKALLYNKQIGNDPRKINSYDDLRNSNNAVSENSESIEEMEITSPILVNVVSINSGDFEFSTTSKLWPILSKDSFSSDEYLPSANIKTS